jgi:hypothetical protein
MKRVKYIIPILVLFMMSSCEDILDQKSPDKLTSETFWRNKTDAEAGIAATYAMLECAVVDWQYCEIKYPVEAYREDIIKYGGDIGNYPTWLELHDFTYTNGNPDFYNYWKLTYTGISRANQAIDKIGKIPAGSITEEDRKQLIAEARFLRAYFHLKLILNWKEIIVFDKYVTAQADLERPLSERNVAWDFIIQDLKAAKDLPKTREANTLGRATNGAANAYLGFAYLTRAWEEPAQKEQFLKDAESALTEVKGYDLVEGKDYLGMFNGKNKNSKESVFELQMSENESNGAYYKTTIHSFMAPKELNGWDEMLPTQRLVDEFKNEGQIATTGLYDSRLYWSLFLNDPYFNDPANPRVYGKTYNDWFSYDKPVFRKFLPENNLDDMDKGGVGYNVPLMRYSNVLLLLAEVYNEQNHPELAIPLINKVRERAEMPPMKGIKQPEVRAQIEHERMIEFPLENWRFYDLRRWGKTKEALHAVGRTNFDPSKHNFYPIPLIEVNSNSKIE